MTDLWNRSVVVQLNNVEYRSRGENALRIDASVTTKRGKFPEAEIKLYNLRPSQIDEALKADRRQLRVRLLAGYTTFDDEEPPLVFDGNIVRYGASVKWEGVDSVLTLVCKEGIFTFDKIVKLDPEQLLQNGVTNVSRAAAALGQFVEQTAGIPASTIIEALANNGPTDAVRASATIARAAGIPEALEQLRVPPRQARGSVAEERYNALAGAVRTRGPGAVSLGGRALASATPIAGSAELGKLALGVINVDPAELAKATANRFQIAGLGEKIRASLEASTGVEITVNRGYIELFERRKPRLLRGPLFSSELGNLLEVPKPIKEKGRETKVVEFKALLTPELYPGDRFEVRSRGGRGDGYYVCMEHTMAIGSGYDTQFYSTVRGRLDP